MKVKTIDLIGPALDWAVANCEGWTVSVSEFIASQASSCKFAYSSVWAKGGPIIEREFIELRNQTSFSGGWEAWKWNYEKQDYMVIGKKGAYCQTALIAAMRCYVASKLGDEVEMPDDLI